MFLYLTYYISVWMLWKDVGVSTWATISNTSYSHFLVPLCFQDLAGRQCCSWQEDKAWNKLWNIKSGGVLYQWRRWLSCWALHWAAGGSRTPPSPRPPCDLRCCPPAHNTNLQLIPRQFLVQHWSNNKGRPLNQTSASSSRKGPHRPFPVGQLNAWKPHFRDMPLDAV